MSNNNLFAKKDYLNKIITGDTLETMKRLPDSSVDFVITSPPYNLKNSTGNGMKDGRGGKWSKAALIEGYSDYNDNMPQDLYDEWQANCLKEMFRIVSDDGAIFYNHKWRVQAGVIQDRHAIVKDLPVRQIIIWRRKGGINFNQGYFLPTYEVVYFIAKKKFKLAKGANSFGDIWEFTQEMNNIHPAPFPESLVERIMLSNTGKTVLDPFMGSGTTGAVAKRLGRNYIGIEISKKYCDLAEHRISLVESGKFVTLEDAKLTGTLHKENITKTYKKSVPRSSSKDLFD